MVGQKHLKEMFDSLIASNKMVNPVLFLGPQGYGKKTLSKYIANKMNCDFVEVESNVDSIREAIESVYDNDVKVVYLFKDIDVVSEQAKNTLLKICEELPRNKYFILTASNESLVLPTIISRSFKYYMEQYTLDELNEFVVDVIDPIKEPDLIREAVKYSDCPGDILLFKDSGKNLVAFVDTILNSLSSVSLSNLLKSAKSVKLKSTGEGYDLDMLLKVFYVMTLERLTTSGEEIYNKLLNVAAETRRKLSTKSCNKSYIYNDFIIGGYKCYLQN